MVDAEVFAARAQAIAARARLDVSVAHARARLRPRSLATDAVESLKVKTVEVAQTGVHVARDRPAATAAVIGAIGLMLARKPVLGWIGAMFGWKHATGDEDAS